MTNPAATRSAKVRERILTEALAYIDVNGLAAFRLRAFAQSIGTSHRMVIHYFGSKSGLLAEVFHRLRRQDIERIRADSHSVRAAARANFSYFSAPASALRVSMFFDLFATAIQQPAEFEDFLGSMADWATLLRDLAVSDGYPEAEASVRARVLMAGLRGLLIELAAGEDREAGEIAFEFLLESTFPAHGPDPDKPAAETQSRVPRYQPLRSA